MGATKDIIVGHNGALPRSDDPALEASVHDALARILTHKQFKDTTRLKRFLTYVVDEALAGRSDRLKGYSIGLEVFDRPEDFDPQADTIVRVQAGQLRRRLDLYYSTDGRSDPLRILLPKGSYVPVFERRQSALPAPSEAEPTDASTPRSADSDAGLEAENVRPGIYVPTFSDLSKEPDSVHFAEGLTAEVINALVQFRYLRIIAGTSRIETRENPALEDIKTRLSADFILTGSVRRQKDLVRVSINLIASKTGEHVMSKIFDRECTPDNLFEIQEEIASYTAASVGAPFGAVNRYNRRLPSGVANNMNGYVALLQFYNMGLTGSGAHAAQMLKSLKEVTETTPMFSSAWAALSLTHAFFIAQAAPNTGYQGHIDEALRCAHKAVTLDRDNSLAFFAEFVAAFHAGDFTTYETSARRALTLNPNDYNLLTYYAITRAVRGEVEVARAYIASARELIATPPEWFFVANAVCDFTEKRFDDILSYTKPLSPSSPVGLILFRIAAAGAVGRVEEVKTLRDTLSTARPNVFEGALETFRIWHPTDSLFDAVKRGWTKAMKS
ncbi:hypothetical protein [Fretibacter rubidus]|uniref:hypothetical protein n=1 Tax=Fretibacter rubidus TaxID=570162 RepID=UPI00352A1EF9